MEMAFIFRILPGVKGPAEPGRQVTQRAASLRLHASMVNCP